MKLVDTPDLGSGAARCVGSSPILGNSSPNSRNVSHMKKAVIAVVFHPQTNAILLIKRRDVPVWVMPGGGVDPGESPEEAVIRECFEETGLHVKIKRQVAEYTPLNRLAHLTYFYECIPLDGEISTGSETRDIDYFPINKLPKDLFFIHHDWIEDAVKHDVAVIRRPLDKVTYWQLIKYFCCNPWQTLRFACSRFGLPFNSKK